MIEVKCQFVIHEMPSERQNFGRRVDRGVVQVVVSNQGVHFIFAVLVQRVDPLDELAFVDRFRLCTRNGVGQGIVQWERGHGHFFKGSRP